MNENLLKRVVSALLSRDHYSFTKQEISFYNYHFGFIRGIGIECEMRGEPASCLWENRHYFSNSVDTNLPEFIDLTALKSLGSSSCSNGMEMTFLFSLKSPNDFKYAVRRVFKTYSGMGFFFSGSLHINLQIPYDCSRWSCLEFGDRSSRNKARDYIMDVDTKKKEVYRSENKYFSGSFSPEQLLSQMLIACFQMRWGYDNKKTEALISLLAQMSEERGELVQPPWERIGKRNLATY